jgi:hypothetical protein
MNSTPLILHLPSDPLIRNVLAFLVIALAMAACHDAPRNNPFDPALTPSVVLNVSLNDTTGTALLEWSPFAGSTDFAAYRVLRKVQGIDCRYVGRDSSSRSSILCRFQYRAENYLCVLGFFD